MPHFFQIQTAEIRNWLRQYSDSQLEAFCQDHFDAVALSFSTGMDYDAKINRLIGYCQRNQGELNRLLKIIEEQEQAGNDKSVPIVIIAMNIKEAKELDTTTEENNPLKLSTTELQELQDFRSFLNSQGVTSLVDYYNEGRDYWRPYFQNYTITEIVDIIAGRINSTRQEERKAEISIRFQSEDFFSADSNTSERAWLDLKDTGAVCIIDVASIFHPAIGLAISDSGILTTSQIAVLAIPPIPSSVLSHAFVDAKLQKYMRLALRRFDEDLDLFCELGISDLLSFKRRLYAILPETEMYMQRSSPRTRNNFRRRMGEPKGISQRIVGPSNSRG